MDLQARVALPQVLPCT